MDEHASKRIVGGLHGLLAAACGLTAGDLVAAWIRPDAAPVVTLGAQTIDLTPTPVKEWVISQFGTADKALLVGTVIVIGLALAALAGVVASRSLVAGVGMLAGLGAVTILVAALRPDAEPRTTVPALVTAVVSTGLLTGLTAKDRPRDPQAPPGQALRRSLLLAGLLALVAASFEGTARAVVRRRTAPAQISLPRPTDRADPLPNGLKFNGVSSFRTSTRAFYRVDTRLSLPIVDVDAWRLAVDGNVQRPVSLTYADLSAMPLMERDITLTCVSNEVGGRYVGSARWLGVRLTDLLDRVGVDRKKADQILSTDVSGMTISTPLAIATDGRDSMIALGMNGQPLPREHGFPARLLVPGLYGFVGATKWLSRLTLTTYDDRKAYWTKRGWATDAPIKPSARIDTPRPFQRVDAGEVIVGGVAWAQHRGGVRAVEVNIDGAGWRRATLGPSAGEDYWRQWYVRWQASTGNHTVAARVITGDGATQSSRRATPFPDGSSGIQELAIDVA